MLFALSDKFTWGFLQRLDWVTMRGRKTRLRRGQDALVTFSRALELLGHKVALQHEGALLAVALGSDVIVKAELGRGQCLNCA